MGLKTIEKSVTNLELVLQRAWTKPVQTSAHAHAQCPNAIPGASAQICAPQASMRGTKSEQDLILHTVCLAIF